MHIPQLFHSPFLKTFQLIFFFFSGFLSLFSVFVSFLLSQKETTQEQTSSSGVWRRYVAFKKINKKTLGKNFICALFSEGLNAGLRSV